MPPKKAPVPCKANLIRQEATAAKQQKEAAWTAHWEHRKDHITKGENKGGTPVANSGGGYKQMVAVLSNTNPTAGPKTKESTFFPTTFTLQDIEKVCKSAYLNAAGQDMKKNFTAAATVAPGNGMKLNFTADSIYPQYDK